MQYPNLEVESNTRVGVISIKNPPGNTLSAEVLRNLDSVMHELIASRYIKVIMITGSGRSFSKGADILEMSNCKTPEEAVEFSRLGQQVFLNIENSPKPVIAVINGLCLGGGLELALSCHLRLAADNAVFGMPEIFLGMIPAFGGSYRLPMAIGRARAMHLVLSGMKIKSDDAATICLVNLVFPKDELMQNAISIASQMANRSSSSMSYALKSIIRNSAMDAEKAMEIENTCLKELFQKHDLIEGVNAFLEKRRPHFTDL
ncbi:MAG: enoyl-CoA hydratase-related protein [Bacteroidia bacterium]|nr:enoyl-CoA hydratase-related protein [Bacteroidia bacterium]